MSFFVVASFGNLLETFFKIKFTIHGSTLTLRLKSMSELELFLVNRGFLSKHQHYGTCKFSWKEPKNSMSYSSNHIKNPMYKKEKIGKKKKSKIL
jgi:hypothetical protein